MQLQPHGSCRGTCCPKKSGSLKKQRSASRPETWTHDKKRRLSPLDRYLIVVVGAGLGGLGRYVTGTWIMAKYGGRFPLGTFMINVSGSFLIGVVMTLLTERF